MTAVAALPELAPAKLPSKSEKPALVVTNQSLVEKIAEACKAVGGIAKRGRNEKQDYDYLMAADVAAAFRHELFDRGLILEQDEESAEFVNYETRNGGVMQECRLKIKFTITDGTDKRESHAFGVGRDTFDKAIYKAKTGATKYFLRGLGLIPDRADPESTEDQEVVNPEHQAPITPANYPPRKPQSEDKPSTPVGAILPFQKNAFLSACKKSSKTQQQITNYLGTLGYETLDEMPKKDFPEALKWAMGA